MDTTDSTQSRRPIYCDDCMMVQMAEVHEDKLVIKKKRHGRMHVLVVPVTGKQGGKPKTWVK